MKTIGITATTKSGKSINILHTCRIADRGERAGVYGLNRYSVEIVSTVGDNEVILNIIDGKVFLTLTKKQVMDILGVSVKGDNNHIAANITVSEFNEWNQNSLKEVRLESAEVATQEERTAILKEAQAELENGIQEIPVGKNKICRIEGETTKPGEVIKFLDMNAEQKLSAIFKISADWQKKGTLIEDGFESMYDYVKACIGCDYNVDDDYQFVTINDDEVGELDGR